MRRIWPMIALICLASGAIAGDAPAEFRGIWVDAFHDGVKTPEQTTEMVNKVADANLNAIFVQVRARGDAYYNSEIVPKAGDIAVEYDPLADVIQKAHAAGLQVHAWLNMLEVTPRPIQAISPQHITQSHPAWIMIDPAHSGKSRPKKYLDPAIPAVREHLSAVVREIVLKYPVDGIHVDAVRSHFAGGLLSDEGTAIYRAATGNSDTGAGGPQWGAWWTEQATELMRQLSASAKVRPGVAFSAAVTANRGAAKAHNLEDWETWLREGIVDFAVPMLFSEGMFGAHLKTALEASDGKMILAGQAAFDTTPEKSVEDIHAARNANAGGVVIYSYCSASEGLLDQLKIEVYQEKVGLPALPLQEVAQ